jgi:hypothetical protein
LNFLGRMGGASAGFLFLFAGSLFSQSIVPPASRDGAASELPDAPRAQQTSGTEQISAVKPDAEAQPAETAAERVSQGQASSPAPQSAPSPVQQTMQSPETAPSQTTTPTQQPADPQPKSDENPDKASDELPKRMFGMIPDFENTNNTPVNQRALTVREKYVLAWHQSTDVSAHVGAAFAAGLQQAGNGQPRYGQGWGPYADRFAAAEGDQLSSSWLIYGILPSLLHDDPRYFRRGVGPPQARVWYAVTRTFVTRRDNGKARFNYSTVSGQLVSCAISTSYYPEIDRATSRVFSNWGLDLVGFSAYNVLSEYYPDLIKAVFHRGKS